MSSSPPKENADPINNSTPSTCISGFSGRCKSMSLGEASGTYANVKASKENNNNIGNNDSVWNQRRLNLSRDGKGDEKQTDEGMQGTSGWKEWMLGVRRVRGDPRKRNRKKTEEENQW